ncbi:glycosyltransferase family 2 protein [Colwellia echini]|uniref:Capsular biosynthesis protein n=1 Tax=Colwellia echini TaxID=1982103 RepID=A0ABY3MVW9_9GAMM|nr:glycosyltransferase family 2 protein [Colwellia echini]TYK65329.1 capsular biosynthesis protein [Colwellia echini]
MIVIPMAGLSSRFTKAGYKVPKYMLEAHGETLFDHAVKSFKGYFKDTPFLFIARDVCCTAKFITARAKALGIVKFHITIIDEETRGQAETVALGLNDCPYEGPITIFNIDTFRPNFKFPKFIDHVDGYLEVFQGEGDNWSFAQPFNDKDTKVIKTAEKEAISDLCCTGLYYFSNSKDFLIAFNEYTKLPKSKWAKGELYIAPLYNLLIEKGSNIHYSKISRDEVIFCGIPTEYLDFIAKES